MKIGISIPWAFLAGMSTDSGTEALRSQYDDVSGFLSGLRKQGLYSIELRHWQDEIFPATTAVFNLIKENGLRVSVHGDVKKNHNTQAIEICFPWLESCLENSVFNDEQKLLIALHPIRDMQNSVEENHRHTLSILRNLDSEIQQKNLPITIAYENQREKGYPDPGIFFEQLASAIIELKSSSIGICWDMGHAYSNYKRQLMADDPPMEFLSSVVHTHIHDLHPESNSTHWPLSCDTIPLKRFVRFLKDVDYEGIYNLELSPNKYHPADINAAFEDSVRILRSAVEEP